MHAESRADSIFPQIYASTYLLRLAPGPMPGRHAGRVPGPAYTLQLSTRERPGEPGEPPEAELCEPRSQRTYKGDSQTGHPTGSPNHNTITETVL